MTRRSLATLLFAASVAALAACSADDGTSSPASVAGTAGATTGMVAPAPAASSVPASPPDEREPPTTSVPSGSVATTSPGTAALAPVTSTLPVPSGRYPAQPDGVPWPTEEWPVGDPPAGVDRVALDAAVDAGFGAADAEARVRAVLVVQGGRIVYERYHPLDGPDEVMPSWSVAKSVTATLVGIAVTDGLLDVDAPAPVPEWQQPDDPRAAITLDDLLRMSSGLEWEERYEAGSDPSQLLSAPHAADVPIAKPLVHEPGTVWSYSTGTSAIIAEVLADTLGGPAALDEFIRERLMSPLGITSTRLWNDSTGQFLGGVGFDSTPRDFARFGLLHLRGGMWDGQRLLTEEWIDRTREPSATNPEYGAHWWLRGGQDAFSAIGLFGQQIVVAPGSDLVVVVTATQGGDPGPVVAAVIEEFAAAG